MTGVYSMGHELAEQGEAPWDHVFCMAGGGGLVLATAVGFEQALAAGKISNGCRAWNACSRKGTTRWPAPCGPAEMQRHHHVHHEDQRSAGADGGRRQRSHRRLPSQRRHGTSRFGSIDLGNPEAARAGRRHLRRTGRFHRGRRARCRPPATARSIPKAYVVCLITGSAFKDPASLDEMISDVSCPLIDVTDLERRVEQETRR